jgi:pimeloyl-ACP methyl ester carboxylesterase
MGYSDPTPHPRRPSTSVDDLHALVEHAGIDGPLVLVGHSLGGFNMKLYAVRYPEQVAGIVLVDPSEERLWDRVGPILAPRFGEQLVKDAAEDDRVGIGEMVKHFQDCAETTRAGRLDEAAYARCTDPVRIQLGPVILAERKRLQATAAYQDAQWAEVAASMFVPDAQADGEYARVFGTPQALGDKPLVVLTHSMWDMTPPFGEASYQSWVTAHRLTAAMSTRGSQRMVPMSRHNIQIDQPQAVIDAVAEVLAAVKAP